MFKIRNIFNTENVWFHACLAVAVLYLNGGQTKFIKWVFYCRTSVLRHILCYLWSELTLLPEVEEYSCEPCMYLEYFLVINSWCSWSTPWSVSPGRWVLQKKKEALFWNFSSGLIAVKGSAGSADTGSLAYMAVTWALCASSLVYNGLHVLACAWNVFNFTFWTARPGLSFFFFSPQSGFSRAYLNVFYKHHLSWCLWCHGCMDRNAGHGIGRDGVAELQGLKA